MEIEFSDVEGRYFDTRYPVTITPNVLIGRDQYLAHQIRNELKRNCPEAYSWRWLEGNSIDVGQDRQNFAEEMMWYLNKRYKIGTGKIQETIEKCFNINWLELGNGYRLHLCGFCPIKNERRYNHVLLVDFLFRKKGYVGPADGMQRAVRCLRYLEQMPNNPYSMIVIRPMGSEYHDKYSPHLKACGYQKVNHSTAELIKMYKFWLKIKRTNQKSINGRLWPEDTYWRVAYRPKYPIYKEEDCPYPQLLEITEGN